MGISGQLAQALNTALGGDDARNEAATRLTGTIPETCTFGPVTATSLSTTGAVATGNQATTGTLTVTVANANAIAIGPSGTTNPTLNVDSSAANTATGLNLVGAAKASGFAISVSSSGTDENLTFDAKGAGTVTINGTATGAITLARNTGVMGTATVTSANAAALAVGRQGATSPALNVDASAGTSVTGLNIAAGAAAGGVALSVIGGNSAENLKIDAKGTGTITLGGTSTGGITLTRAVTPSAGIVYGARVKHISRVKVGTTAGFVVGAANNIGSIATVAASQTNSTLVAYVDGLNDGDIITNIRVRASISCTTNNASLDAALHTYTVAAAATAVDAAVANGAITQILQSGTGNLAGNGTNGTPCSSTVATGVQHFILLTATTGASCTIELNSIEVTYTPNPAQ